VIGLRFVLIIMAVALARSWLKIVITLLVVAIEILRLGRTASDSGRLSF